MVRHGQTGGVGGVALCGRHFRSGEGGAGGGGEGFMVSTVTGLRLPSAAEQK